MFDELTLLHQLSLLTASALTIQLLAPTGTNSQLPQTASPASVHVAAQPVAELNARSLFRTELQSLKPAEVVTPDDTAKYVIDHGWVQ